MGSAVKKAAELTKDSQCIGAAKLVVFRNAPEDNPFMAGAFHGVGEADPVLNVGVSGPGVVRTVLAAMPDDAPLHGVAETIKKTAFKITRVGQLVGSEVASTSIPSSASSTCHSLRHLPNRRLGSSHPRGNRPRAVGSTRHDGSARYAQRCSQKGRRNGQAMTAVCSVGLDMIVIPGDTTAEVISAIIADEAAIGMVNSKTTAVRVIPAIGLKEGEELNFGGLLGFGPVMKLRSQSPAKMINRGGRIPAPLQSLKELKPYLTYRFTVFPWAAACIEFKSATVFGIKSPAGRHGH